MLEAAPEPPSKAVTRPSINRSAPEIASARRTSAFRLRYALSGDLDRIVLKALAADPDARYRSVSQLREDLLRYVEGRPILARRPTFVYVARRGVTRRARLIGQAVKTRTARSRSSPHLDSELSRIAALNNMGVVLTDVGETTEALHKFEQALRISEEIAERNLGDAEVWRAISMACNRMGVMTTKTGNPHAALKLFRKALFVNESLTARDRRDDAAHRNMVGNSKNVAVIYEMLSSEPVTNWSARLQYLELARTWYRRALETVFEMQREGLARKEEEGWPIELAYSLRECEQGIARLRTLQPGAAPSA